MRTTIAIAIVLCFALTSQVVSSLKVRSQNSYQYQVKAVYNGGYSLNTRFCILATRTARFLAANGTNVLPLKSCKTEYQVWKIIKHPNNTNRFAIQNSGFGNYLNIETDYVSATTDLSEVGTQIRMQLCNVDTRAICLKSENNKFLRVADFPLEASTSGGVYEALVFMVMN